MSHLLFWPTITFFYPVGNTSAVCLTENLSPESKADVLLLACGDPRHLLYTIYANETNPLTCLRTFDITCCDVDATILARNTLLFTLLADDDALHKLDNLWNLFYHMFVDQTTLSILSKQCRKLVALAESTGSWRAGPYGHFLTTCDAMTLSELRRIWNTYLDMATLSSKRAKQLEQHFINGRKEMSRMMGSGGTTAAVRSAGPLLLHASEAVSSQFSNYWSSGTTDTRNQGQKQHLQVNPTFAFSIDGDRFAVHYGTDPLCGFHLAEAFASGRFTSLDEPIPPHEVVRVAKDQFSRWCTSVSKRLKDCNPSSPTFVIRMFAGDALTFSQALKYCEVTRSPVTPYNVAAWRLSTITLDDHYYGHSAVERAPLSFNVIDTSNILDHLGLVNVLVVTAPLLKKSPSARLYTEALLRVGENPSQAILEYMCGDLPTIALLLGIIPSTSIFQFTTRSNVHETLTMHPGAKQCYERLAWKVIGFGFGGPRTQHESDDVPALSQSLFFPPKDLAKLLFHIYVQMFSHEDMKSRFKQLLSLSRERMLQTIQQSANLHYNRRSFALLVHLVKTRIQTDWSRTMELFECMVLTDRRLLTGQQAYQELCCHLHLLGVYTAEWISVPALQRHYLEFEANLGPFRDWSQSSIPQVVTLVLVVPRDTIGRLEHDFMDVGTPILQCQMDDGPRQNWFAVTSATFGTLRVSGTGEHRTAAVVEGNANTGVGSGTHARATQPLWRSGAPLIITFAVPSASVMDFGRKPSATVGLGLRATPVISAKFTSRLGFDLMVYRTKLTDAKRVFVLAQTPAVGTSANTSTGRSLGGIGASAGIAGHWQENMREAAYSGEGTSSPDIPQGINANVHVQMNNLSSAVQSFTVHINITDPGARAALANMNTIPTLDSGSRSMRSLEVCMRIEPYTYSIHFPLPVDVSRTKLRFASLWSSYIKIVAPLAPFDVRPERDLSNKFSSLSLDSNDHGTPTLGGIHYLNLDQCPTFQLPRGSSELNWCEVHLSHMFSELEKTRALPGRIEPRTVNSRTSTSTPGPDTLLRVKQTLHLLLRTAADATHDGKAAGKVFALCDTSRRDEPYLYIIVARMCLDVGSHTVVADTFVAAGTPAVHEALDAALSDASKTVGERGAQKPDDMTIRPIATDANETAAWFHLLPQLTERCRTWPHKMNCAYRTTEQQEQQPSEQIFGNWGMQGPLCTCGAGVGTEILPREFERVAPYLTRAAFSPLLPVLYLKEVNVPLGGQLIKGPFSVSKLTGWLVIASVCFYVIFLRK